MKRELAFALGSRSLILKSAGKTRSNRVPVTCSNSGSGKRAPKRATKHAVNNEPSPESTVTQNEVAETPLKECDDVGKDLEEHVDISQLNNGAIVPLECTDVQNGEPEDGVDVPIELETPGVDLAEYMVIQNDVVGAELNVPIELETPGINLADTVPIDCTVAQIEEAKDGVNVPIGLEKPGINLADTFPIEVEIAKIQLASYGIRKSSNVEATSSRAMLIAKKIRRGEHSFKTSTPRRSSRSALKVDEDGETFIVTTPIENSSIFGDRNNVGFLRSSLSKKQKRKLEMKMSKQIALSKIPTTVEELLETGLLEGCQVYYNGGKKGAGLQGTIRGAGILCFCVLCKGRCVIPPSQFEIHACNGYKRASQYICLDNGTSLIQLLQACRNSKLNTLEVTIQNAIGSLHKRNLSAPQNFRETSSAATCAHAELVFVKQSSSPIGSKGTPRKTSGSHKLLVPNCVRTTMVKSMSIQNTKISSRSPMLKSKDYSERRTFGKITKKDQGMHRRVFGKNGLPDGTALAYYVRGKRLLEGHKEGFGIFCNCCHSVVSASQFEAHAGESRRRKAYSYIYTSNGVSLHEYAVSLLRSRKHSARDNDDLCFTCHNGGDLLLCDGCPRSYHKECAALLSLPRGKWFCDYCRNMFEREKCLANNANARAAGRISGSDPIDEIGKRCIRIVKKSEDHGLTVCALCRRLDFIKCGFGPRTILICDQCEKEYHVSCLRDHKLAELKELPQGNWFCRAECERIHSILRSLVLQGNDELSKTLVDVIRRKHMENCAESQREFNVSWRLMNGKILSEGDKPMLKQIVHIFHNGFSPILYPSGEDLIPGLVHGEKVDDLEYGGMYTAALTVNSEVVSAAVFRVFGLEVAELPLVATGEGNRGKGFFQALYSCIESLFAYLNIRKIVLPAAEEAEGIWTKKFGFSRMSPKEIYNCEKTIQTLLRFQGTVMLHKMMPEI